MKSSILPLAAVATVVALGLGGCATSTASTSAAAAQPLSGQALVSLELTESSSDLGLYLRQQAAQLDGGAAEFAAAYRTGDDALARALYASTRMFYNRTLVVEDSFAPLAARLDGSTFAPVSATAASGWHAIETDLYPAPGQTPFTPAERDALATQLTADTHALYLQLVSARPAVIDQATGTAALFSGRATDAANGREDSASGSDISDLQGYLDGAKVVFQGIRPVLVTQDAALATTLDHQFEALQESLNAQRTGVAFKTYSAIDKADLASLRAQVADLTASLNRVAPTLLPVVTSQQ